MPETGNHAILDPRAELEAILNGPHAGRLLEDAAATVQQYEDAESLARGQAELLGWWKRPEMEERAAIGTLFLAVVHAAREGA